MIDESTIDITPTGQKATTDRQARSWDALEFFEGNGYTVVVASA